MASKRSKGLLKSFIIEKSSFLNTLMKEAAHTMIGFFFIALEQFYLNSPLHPPSDEQMPSESPRSNR